MKRTVLFIAAALMSLVSMAQITNLALNKTATASSGDAAAAVDGNVGTRWESAQTDNEWWMVDLGEVSEFNTIQIIWEGAYTKTFTITASSDGEAFSEIVSIENQSLSGFPHVQNLRFSAVNARYIKFNVIARGTQWGNSFYEFGVYNAPEPALTSLVLSASANVAKVGTPVTLTAKGLDQLGSEIATGDVTFEVSPENAGVVSGTTYTPALAGSATIVAKAGEITSNAISVVAYEGDKINLFANWQEAIEPLGPDTKTDSKVGAFDDNMASVWELHGVTGADAASRTYETGFIADLGKNYDITNIAIRFEGACSEDYTIAFAGSNKEFGAPAFTVTGHPGMATYTVYHMAGDAENGTKGVHYVKFLSTKAATQYGVKIFDFSVYGIETGADATIPTLEDPVAEATGDNSIKVTAKATDTAGGDIKYYVTVANATYETTAAAGADAVVEISGLKAGKTYTVSVIAENATGNKTAAKTTEVTTTGTPDPNLWADAEKATSVFYSADWEHQIEGYTFDITETTAHYVLPVATTNQWMSQFSINTDIKTDAANEYDFKCNITADKDVAVTVKLFQTGNNDLYYFSDAVNLKAGETYVYDKQHVKMEGIDMTAVTLLIDFGGNPADLTVDVTDILFKINDGEEPVVVEPLEDNACNLYRAATVTPKFFYAPGWAQLPDPEVKAEAGVYTYTLESATYEPWQAQAFFISDIETNDVNNYDFSVTITSSENVNGTLKLYQRVEEGGSNDVFLFNEQVTLKAEKPFVYRNDAMKGINMQNITLLFDCGGNPANTTIYIANPVLRETGCDPEIVTGIRSIENSEMRINNSDYYNLAGQKVSKDYKGIVIKNGKKLVK